MAIDEFVFVNYSVIIPNFKKKFGKKGKIALNISKRRWEMCSILRKIFGWMDDTFEAQFGFSPPKFKKEIDEKSRIRVQTVINWAGLRLARLIYQADQELSARDLDLGPLRWDIPNLLKWVENYLRPWPGGFWVFCPQTWITVDFLRINDKQPNIDGVIKWQKWEKEIGKIKLPYWKAFILSPSNWEEIKTAYWKYTLLVDLAEEYGFLVTDPRIAMREDWVTLL